LTATDADEEFIEEVQQSSTIRALVLEVTRPIHGTKRIVNTDNFYTSVQLLEALRLKGLYGRGTCRENSKHFFKGIQISKKDNYSRGVSFQAVCIEHKMIAASWVDASVVNIVSNADDSRFIAVERRIKQNKVKFKAPKCVREYNSGIIIVVVILVYVFLMLFNKLLSSIQVCKVCIGWIN
jgi:hypothetical protein